MAMTLEQKIERLLEYYPLLFEFTEEEVLRVRAGLSGEVVETEHRLSYNHNKVYGDEFIELESISPVHMELFDLYVGDDENRVTGMINDDFTPYNDKFYALLYHYGIGVGSETNLQEKHRLYTIKEITNV